MYTKLTRLTVKWFCLALISLLNITSVFSQNVAIDTSNVTDGSPVQLTVSGKTITPPEGYIFLEDYDSFLNRNTETSITVTYHDTLSYYVVVASILENDFNGQDVSIVDQEELPNGQGIIVTFVFNVQNIPVERMVYLTGNSKNCVVVNCNYKQTDRGLYREILKNSALSISY